MYRNGGSLDLAIRDTHRPGWRTHRSEERRWAVDGVERNAQRQLARNIRALSSRAGAVRAHGINLWDISAHKNFKIYEKVTLQLRGEAEGAMNHPNFSPPNTNPVNSLFGQVTSTQTGQEERRIFVGLKVLF